MLSMILFIFTNSNSCAEHHSYQKEACNLWNTYLPKPEPKTLTPPFSPSNQQLLLGAFHSGCDEKPDRPNLKEKGLHLDSLF